MKRGRLGEREHGGREQFRAPQTADELRREEEGRITSLIVRLGEKSLEGIHGHLDTLARVRRAAPLPPRSRARAPRFGVVPAHAWHDMLYRL